MMTTTLFMMFYPEITFLVKTNLLNINSMEINKYSELTQELYKTLLYSLDTLQKITLAIYLQKINSQFKSKLEVFNTSISTQMPLKTITNLY